MTLTNADVWNENTPRTQEAKEQIKDQLDNGHGTIETGDPTTSLNYEEPAKFASKKAGKK